MDVKPKIEILKQLIFSYYTPCVHNNKFTKKNLMLSTEEVMICKRAKFLAKLQIAEVNF